MKMTNTKMRDAIKERLDSDKYEFQYNRKENTLRIEWKDTENGVTVTIPNLVQKYNERGEEVLDAFIDHIEEAFRMMNEKVSLEGSEKNIFPVIRSTSFPTESKAGKKLVHKDHTAETRVFYALDEGKSYRMIEEDLLKEAGWTEDHLDEIAMFNARSLSTDYKVDSVAGNDFYFIATQDGYDASRILNEAFLEEMYEKMEGEMAVATPHQDVLIIVDVKNETGYDVLAQITMKYFTEGRIPITSLSFIYEDKKLEPVFILAKNRPKPKKHWKRKK